MPIWYWPGQTTFSMWWGSRRGEGVLLWWGVLDEFDTLLNVALETLDASLEELLLLSGDAAKNVDGLLRAIGL